jgi:sugar phosphate isomerase/epimerase
MILGYNTNGLAHHDLLSAVELLADIGYGAIGITIDHHALSPFATDSRALLSQLGSLLERRGMRSVIETGARFLLDPQKKHEPTLLSADRRRRIDFYRYAIDCAAALGSDCVSLWSGVLHEPISRREAEQRLIDGLREVTDYAASKSEGLKIGVEPEPGMLIDSMQAWEEIFPRIDAPNLGITLDIGHLHCQGETPIAPIIRRWASRLVNIHIEDMRCGMHEHLMFGEGEIDFPPILHAVSDVHYAGGVYVELSRHSHEGPDAARKAFEFLRRMLASGVSLNPATISRNPPSG